MEENKIKLEDIKWNCWYRVLIGFSKEPEIRSGDCVKSLLKSTSSIKILGSIGEIQDFQTYAYVNDIEI